jgi:hypothetical protein
MLGLNSNDLSVERAVELSCIIRGLTQYTVYVISIIILSDLIILRIPKITRQAEELTKVHSGYIHYHQMIPLSMQNCISHTFYKKLITSSRPYILYAN